MRNTVARCSLGVVRSTVLASLVLFVCLGAFAQETKAPTAAPRKAQAPAAEPQKPAASEPRTDPEQQPPAAVQQPGINSEFGRPLAEESREAAGAKKANEGAENDQEKMVEEMKHSPSVRWMAEHLHITAAGGYWFGILLDFAILALLIVWAMKKNLPTAFRTRTAGIQKGIEEARKASEEANRRLANIEARLSKLDDEVAEMRVASEQEAAAEEQRILAAAEEDKKRIVEGAEGEIAAAAKLARRELKAFAAELAVTLAERRIQVDSATDQALVRSFTDELGNNSSGKDGR